MKIDNEVMWNTAEQFAKVVNDAYHKRFEHDNLLTNKETFIKIIGWIVNGETKRGFVGNCAKIIKFMPSVANELGKIVEEVIKLPLSIEADNQDFSFEMFLALAKFHIECVKPNWK